MAASEAQLINSKLLVKNTLCKNMLSKRFSVFHKNSLKESVEQSKNKKSKKHYHKTI